MLDKCIARLAEDLHESLAIKRNDGREDRQTTDEFGDHSELQQVLWHHLAEDVARVRVLFLGHISGESQ